MTTPVTLVVHQLPSAAHGNTTLQLEEWFEDFHGLSKLTLTFSPKKNNPGDLEADISSSTGQSVEDINQTGANWIDRFFPTSAYSKWPR